MKTIILTACLLLTACVPQQPDGAHYLVTHYHGSYGKDEYRADQVDSSYGSFKITLTNGDVIRLQGDIRVERLK